MRIVINVETEDKKVALNKERMAIKLFYVTVSEKINLTHSQSRNNASLMILLYIMLNSYSDWLISVIWQWHKCTLSIRMFIKQLLIVQ